MVIGGPISTPHFTVYFKLYSKTRRVLETDKCHTYPI
jgi:hypothetical protein